MLYGGPDCSAGRSATDHGQLKTSRQGTGLRHCQLSRALLCATDGANAGYEGELAAALVPARQEMVEMGLGEDEEKNGSWAL